MSKIQKQAGNLLPITVAEGLTVNVLPNDAHEYLMTTKEVARGYGVTDYAIRKNKLSLDNELVEGKHFIKGVTISNTLRNYQPHAILWTKRGIVRLGFGMRSERAKMFRDWAEELIIRVDALTEQGVSVASQKTLPNKRNHNRLTSERLINLLTLTHRIDNAELRNEIVEQLMGGRKL